jgi:ribonuclease HI
MVTFCMQSPRDENSTTNQRMNTFSIQPETFPLDQRTVNGENNVGKGYIQSVRAWRVETDPTASEWIGAAKATNNTAELTAIIEAIAQATDRTPGAGQEEIHSDSLYAINMTTGKWSPKHTIHAPPVNLEIIWHARMAWIQLQRLRPREVQLIHIRSHTKHPGNEVADHLADVGRQGGSMNVASTELWLANWLTQNPDATARPPGYDDGTRAPDEERSST